ncbi:MAG: glycosyltransferase [Ignavibacteriales bacterium]|nr:glycosyltransferase [Ignavibacteriales bacterium]
MNVLHVAPLNVAGVPYSMMAMQRRFGANARLVTLHANALTFPEDICLNLPLPRNTFARIWRDFKKSKTQQTAANQSKNPDTYLPIHEPKNFFEKIYFSWDDTRREPAIRKAMEQYDLDKFEIIHFDGGLDFFRDARTANQWKREGKKIICHYMGSDLRVRGIDPVMNELSDLNLTNESDHLLRHPDIHYIYIPFDVAPYKMRMDENKHLRIVHSPTNRDAKGTELILPVMERVKKARNVEFVLIENTPHDEVLRIKQTCDIAIEQVGNMGGTGYGRNSLETLAMGIPTITEMTPDYTAWLPENPFVLASRQTLFERLIELIDNPQMRAVKSAAGRTWVEKYHSYESVHNRLMELYREHHIV